MKINFITNLCTHYVVRLFELLSERHEIRFYFTGGDESYWNTANRPAEGNIKGKYLKKLTKARIMPGVLFLPFKKGDVCIKTLDGRFSLAVIFLITKLMRRPFILWTGLWAHPETLMHQLTFPFTRFIYRHSDAIVVYGEHVKKYLIGLGVDREKIFCAPHSVDNSLMSELVLAEQKSALKKELGLAEEKVILYVGRLERCKGLEFLIEGLSKLRDIDFMMVFIGNGSLEGALKNQCEQSSVKAKFLGHIPNEKLVRYYALADAFVLPSITTTQFKEPWGLVINEAMNQGCPIVTTDAVGAAAGGLVENGRNGYIVPEKDSQALKEALEQVLTDEEQRKSMEQYSRNKIREWDQQQTAAGFLQAIDYVTVN